MSRKQKTYGICRLCGENKELTFEHVPPETVFNKGAVIRGGRTVGSGRVATIIE